MSVSSPTDSNVKAYFETEYGTLFLLVRLDNAVDLKVSLGKDRVDGEWVCSGRSHSLVVGDWFTSPQIESLNCNFTIRWRPELPQDNTSKGKGK